ncbi:MAG TPA: substrate-binding domain-containing protein [Halanaerobiales bacterium]|nr:substrate-binding domain-containing protein [Halanaerobiales bacterium]
MKSNYLKILLMLTLVLTIISGVSFAEDMEFGILVCNMSHSFFVDLIQGAEDAGAELGVEIVTYDAQDDPAQQVRQVEDSVVLGFDAIILNPTDVDAMVPAVRQALNSDVLVLTVDRDVRNVGQLAYIGTNNVVAAKAGAEKMVELLETSGKAKPWQVVVLDGTPGASAAIERGDGFMEVIDPLADTGDVEITAKLSANFDRSQGLNVMQDILATADRVDAVIAANDEMALGAVTAIKEAGLEIGYPDGTIVVGFDAIGDAFESIRREEMDATVAQAPYLMGYWGVHAAYANIVEGWNPPADTPIYGPTESLHLGTDSLIITTENVDEAEELILEPKPLP